MNSSTPHGEFQRTESRTPTMKPQSVCVITAAYAQRTASLHRGCTYGSGTARSRSRAPCSASTRRGARVKRRVACRATPQSLPGFLRRVCDCGRAACHLQPPRDQADAQGRALVRQGRRAYRAGRREGHGAPRAGALDWLVGWFMEETPVLCDCPLATAVPVLPLATNS